MVTNPEMTEKIRHTIYKNIASNRKNNLKFTLSVNTRYPRCFYVFPSEYGISKDKILELYKEWALTIDKRFSDLNRARLQHDAAVLESLKDDRLYECLIMGELKAPGLPLVLNGYTVPQYWRSSFVRYR
jgi:hypothetical protein